MPASLWYLAAGRRLPLLLGCVLLLLRLAAGKASQQAASGPPVLPRFHTLVQLADPGATPANARDNIQFCDFFDARSLQPNLADGFDDLSYMSSFFNVATSPLARAGQPSSRPREFIHGPAYSPHRCHSYPFAREPAAPFRMEPDRLSALNPVLTEAFSYGRSLLHRAHDHLVDGLYTFDPMRLVLGTTAAGSPFALQARVQYDGLEFMFLEENNFPSHHFMLEYEGFNFLQPTDLDGDGLVDAVTVAWLADIIAVDTGHPAPHAHGASNGSPASDSESMVAATPTSPPARTGEHGLFWLHRFGEAALAPGNPADVTLLMTLPDDIEVGQILIGDFDGDGLASDVAVLSGRDSTGPARIILLLTSDLSAPVTILLADMSFDDPALVSLSSLDHTPKAAAARLTATTGTGTATTPADDLVVAFGSRVWLIPGPIRPTGSPVTHDILALNSVPLLPDHPSTSGVWYSLAFGDFDADGHLDLALAHSDTVNDILLLSQVHATPRCLCGPGGICQRDPTSFYSLPSCACEDPHADLGFKLAPCEFCQVGYFRQTESSPCQQCSASCLTCAGPGMSDCLSCQPGFVFESSPLPTGLCVPDTTGNQVVVTFPDPERPYYQATSEIDLTIGFHVVPFNLHSTLQKTQTLVELRLQELFTMPTSKPTLVQGINHGNGHVIFHEDRLGGHLLHSRLSLAINRVTVSGPAGSIDMFLLGDRGDVCIAEPGKPCARFQTQWVSWLHNAHLGRVAPRPTPGDPPFVGILSNGHLGTRQVVDSHIHSAIWLQVDNNLDLDSVVVLHSPPSGPSKECHLGWQPRLAIDIFSYTYPMTAENLLPHTLPCGQLLGLPAVDPATRPPLLLVVTEPAAGEAFVYLLRNRGRGSDFRPHFDAPVPLLTGANLGHKTGHSPSRVLATLDPTDLTATEAALFLWDGTWVFRVVLRQHVPPGAGHSDSVTVLVEPLVPRTSFSWLSSASNLVLMPLDADGDGVAELVIFIPTGLMTLFRRSSEQNGCGCGRLGVCTIPSSWSASRCDGPAADSSCVYEPTALRTSDLCACAPGFQSPAGGSSGLCTMCDSSASGGFPPEFGVDCDACSVEGCYLCDASGECLRCRPGLVRTPTGGCAPTCPDPDAPVADAVCQARDPSDMWISSAEIPAHPSWAGARLVDVSTLRFVHQSNTPPGTRAAATTFPTLHVLPPNAVDSDTVWLLPAARLLADGRPADFGQLHLPAAAAWLANTCHLEGVVLPAADHKGPAAEDVDDGADAGPAMGMASPGPLARLSGRPPGVPRASGGDFTVAAVSQPRQLVDHSGVDMVPWSVLNRGEFPVPRPWFARLAEPFPGFGEEPGPTPTPPVYSQMFHFQRQLNSFYMVAEMEPVLFAPAPRVDPSDFRTCTLANTMEEAATRLTVYQSPELQDLRGQPYCSYSRIWVSLPAWELSMVPGQQSWSMSLSTIVLLHRPSNGERPSLVVLTREEAYRADQTGCHYRSLRVPLVAGAPALPIIPPSPSLASIVSLPIFLHVASVQEVHPAAGIAGPGIIAVGEHPYIANRLVVALSPSEPSPVNLQFALMRLLEDMPYLVFVRTDNLADSIMAMSTECLVENHKNWQMPSAPGPVLPEWAWPTTRPLYGCAPVLLETRPLDGHGPHGRPTVHSRDMDGDGLDDLVLHWPTTNRLVVYYTQVTAPLSFRQTVILPGNPQDSLGTQAVEDPALLTPQLFLADVDGDRFVDILLFDQAAPAGVRSSTPSGPVLRLFGRSDQTSNWCPAEVDYDPVTDECVCRGRLRHLTPLSDACECITHAVPVAPGAPDCVCPCSSHRSNSCTACPGAHVLDRGYCREACPRLGFFEEAKTCRACHSSCLSCTGPGAGQCELCPRTHLFRDSHCLDGCPPGSTPLAGECAECAATCLDCAGPEASQCTACGPAMPSLWNGSCLETCPAGTFPGSDPSTSDTCLLCSSLCLECAGLASNQCAECAGDLLLHPVYGCASACGTGFLEAQGQCVTCHSSCRQCQDSPGFCTQCPAGKLLGTTPGTCADVCSACDMACGTCSGPGPDGCLEPNCDQPGKCPGNSSRSLILAIVLPLVFLLLLLVLAVILVCLLARRRRREAAKQGQAIPMQHIGDPEDMTVMNTMIELSLPGHLLLSPGVDYRIEPGCKELGKGAQAVVLPCTLLRTDLCTAAGGDAGAVKMVPADSSLRTQFEPLLDQEIAILSILLADGGSPFVCQLVGYSAAPSKALVMPHYPGLLEPAWMAEYRQIYRGAWAADPLERPSVTVLAEALAGLLTTSQQAAP
ncbi:hypothetical protein H696_00031 [Fonticula alba]|uniref:Serine/threonine protein kinase n=1 Tax=Fonticula alba TaxID=691883 RepID=A0A058ZG48_FONAL|nr:hypothetical protein H696_00031 [Fonticula alba]KCV72442.1 hypothetical protein H696_00031 [Fonticula alba]|eukprot:XP_009492143.1 hypothetical protein H696_00031 [Fonticula alba]